MGDISYIYIYIYIYNGGLSVGCSEPDMGNFCTISDKSIKRNTLKNMSNKLIFAFLVFGIFSNIKLIQLLEESFLKTFRTFFQVFI